MSCEHCTMDIHKSGKMAWWQGAEYVDGVRSASVQAGDAACEHFELFVEECDKWNDETYVTSIPIRCCPWCGDELRKEGGEDIGERNSEQFVEHAAHVAKELHDEAFILLEGCDEPEFSAIDAICGFCADIVKVAKRWRIRKVIGDD